jgi:hypothetical protein
MCPFFIGGAEGVDGLQSAFWRLPIELLPCFSRKCARNVAQNTKNYVIRESSWWVSEINLFISISKTNLEVLFQLRAQVRML